MNYRICSDCGAALDPGEICDCAKETPSDFGTYTLHGKQYRIIGYIDHPVTDGPVPLLDIPMMSDYSWKQKCLQDRIDHPEKYAKTEDVAATIRELTRWLAEHEPGVV